MTSQHIRGISSPTCATVPPPPGAMPSRTRPGVLRRIFDAIIEPRQKQADRDIARFLARSGGRLTDDIERQITQRLLTGHWTTMALVSVLVLGSTSGALALEGYDGDNNPIPGYTRQAPSSIERSFAAPRPTVRRRGIERSFAAPQPAVTGRVRSYGANGPAWQRNFDNYLSSVD